MPRALVILVFKIVVMLYVRAHCSNNTNITIYLKGISGAAKK